MGAGAGRLMHDPLARQMRWKRAARRFLRRLAFNHARCIDVGRGLACGNCRDQLVELQFHLIEQTRAFFRRRAVRVALHLGDGQLQVSNLAVKVECAGFGSFGARIRRKQQRC